MQKSMKTGFFLILFALPVLAAYAQDNDDGRYSEHAEKTATARQQEIRAEIKLLGDHLWAGEYYEGDGLGENVALAIAPGAGYVFECHGCVGLYDRNYGAAEWKNERLRLAFTFENRRKGFKGIAEEFIPVAWGPRKYLIPAAGVIGFCNDVNCGREPRKAAHGRYLLRCGDEEKRVTGLPTLPPEFQAYALRQPITAEIVAVGSRTTRPQPVLGGTEVIDTVTLGVGKKGGLLPGMKLYTTASEMDSDAVEVMTVDEEKAEGKLTRHYLFLPYSRPSVGWKLSTRDPFCEWLAKAREKESAKK